MIQIEWNRVTWYSKAIAVAVYILTFALAFSLGAAYQRLAYEKAAVEKALYGERWTPPARGETACTTEAMLCPDGLTYVGRTGPNCEFAACPGASTGAGKISIPPSQPMPPKPEGGELPAPGVPEPGPGVMCAADAKLCSDGSSVGRIGPRCEFAPCPGE